MSSVGTLYLRWKTPKVSGRIRENFGLLSAPLQNTKLEFRLTLFPLPILLVGFDYFSRYIKAATGEVISQSPV